MKFLFSIIAFAFLWTGCAQKEKKQLVLSQDAMRAVMWDMIRADVYVSDHLLKDSTRVRKNESVKLYEEIFQVHKTTREAFKKSLDYYTSRPDLFSPIIDSLAKRKMETYSTPFQRFNKDSANKPVFRDSVKIK